MTRAESWVEFGSGRALPGATSWARALDTITASVYGVVALGFFVLMVVPAMGYTATAPRSVALVLGLFVVAQVLAVKDLGACGRERARYLPAVLGLSLTALLIAFHALPPGPGGDAWWPLNVLFQLGIYLIGITYGSRTGWVATLVASGGVLLAVFVATPMDFEDQVRRGVIEMVVLAGILGTTDLWIRGQRRIAVESDRVDAQRMADLRSSSRADREAERLRDVERYIHDEVLHSLRAVAMDRADLPGSQVRAWMQRLSQQMRPAAIHAEVGAAAPDTVGAGDAGDEGSAAGAGSTAAAGGSALAGSPEADAEAAAAHSDLIARLHAIDVPLDVQWNTPRRLALPTEVTDAIVAASVEALRNVVRHAQVPTAEVTVRSTSTTVEVVVRDEGVGFDPREPRLTRHGVARSVLGRMNDLGGTAKVESRPGEGTSVVLRWSPHIPRVGGRTFPWNDATVRDLVRRCVQILGPAAIACVVLTVLNLGDYARPGLAIMAATTIVLVMILVPRFVLDRGLTGLESTGLTILGVLVALAYGFAVPLHEGSTTDFSAMPFASLIPILLLFTRPQWEGMVAWVAMSLTSLLVVLVHVTSVEEFADLWSVIISPSVALAVGIVMRMAIDRFGSATYLAIDARQRAQGEVARTRAVRDSVVARLDQVNRAVRTFIDDVAAGRLDVADPAVRARADELERDVREDLSLGPAPGLRGAVETLRASGATVDLRVPGDPPTEVDSAVEAIIRALVVADLQPANDGEYVGTADTVFRDGVGSSSLGLTVTPRGAEWTVSLLAHTPSAQAADSLAVQWRAALADQGVTVLNIEGDVRARAVVPVADPTDDVAAGRRDA